MRYRPFPLHPDIPEAGVELEAYFGAARKPWLDAMRQRLYDAFRAEGLPYSPLTRTFNTRRAQELAEWAWERDPGLTDALHDALFEAVFVHGHNIAELDVLADIAQTVGYPAEAARAAVETGAFAAAVDDAWRTARALGITAVPTFVAGGAAMVGAQPVDNLRALLNTAGSTNA